MNRRAISTVLLAGCALAATASSSAAQTPAPQTTPPPSCTSDSSGSPGSPGIPGFPVGGFPGLPGSPGSTCFPIPSLPMCDADGKPSDTGTTPCPIPPTTPPPTPPPTAPPPMTPAPSTTGSTKPPPPPPPSPPAAPAAAVTNNANVGLRSGKRFGVDSDGHVTLGTVTCPVTATFCPFISSRLAVPGHATNPSYAKRTLRPVPGQRMTLSFTLIRAARARLTRHGSLQTQVVVHSGSAAPVTRIVTLHD